MNDGVNAPAGQSTAPQTTLWVLRKGDHMVTCLVFGKPDHEELQVVIDHDLYLSETHTVHEGVIGRASTLRRGFEARGWKAA